MKKTGVVILFLLVLFSLNLAFAQESANSNEAELVKAYTCLANQVKSDCSGAATTEEISLVILSGVNSSIAKSCADKLVRTRVNFEGFICWSSGATGDCDIKSTSHALLALDSLKARGINYRTADLEKIQNWLISKGKNDDSLSWYLQQDSTGRAECELGFLASADSEWQFSPGIIIDENKKILTESMSGKLASTCFDVESNNPYWFKIKSSCYNYEFKISCDVPFTKSLIYKDSTTPSLIWNVLGGSELIDIGDAGTFFIRNKCFSGSSSCDYFPSLWATYSLAKSGIDMKEYFPYLVSRKSLNLQYFPDAFLSLISSTGNIGGLTVDSGAYSTALMGSGYYNSNRKFWIGRSSQGSVPYNSGLSLLALDSSSFDLSESKVNLLSYSFSENNRKKSGATEGCWAATSSSAVKDTAMLLYGFGEGDLEPANIPRRSDVSLYYYSTENSKGYVNVSVNIFTKLNKLYVNYTSAIPQAHYYYDIVSYNISIVNNSNGAFAKSLAYYDKSILTAGSPMPASYFSVDNILLADLAYGDYKIRVTSCDEVGLCSYGDSLNFVLSDESSSLFPQAPLVFAPSHTQKEVFRDEIIINYSEAKPQTGYEDLYPIKNYSIYLTYLNETSDEDEFVTDIETVDASVLGYVWDSTSSVSEHGEYKVKVKAYNSNGKSAEGESGVFVIDRSNAYPGEFTISNPNKNSYYLEGESLLINYTRSVPDSRCTEYGCAIEKYNIYLANSNKERIGVKLKENNNSTFSYEWGIDVNLGTSTFKVFLIEVEACNYFGKCTSEYADLNVYPNDASKNPTIPVFVSPVDIVYENSFIPVNYTASVAYRDSVIEYYNLTLVNGSTNAVVKFLVKNNAGALYYSINAAESGIPEGDYKIKIVACDAKKRCSGVGYSDSFSITYDPLPLPPIPPVILSPEQGRTYSEAVIIINYSAAIPQAPYSYPISFYNITLLNSEQEFVRAIRNNFLNLSYAWNSREAVNGVYVLKVQACDNSSKCSYDSVDFTINNSAGGGGGGGGGPSDLDCERSTYHCVSGSECLTANIASTAGVNYVCSPSSLVCCKTVPLKTCSEERGVVCESGKECSIPLKRTSDKDNCCLGECRDPSITTNVCETKGSGYDCKIRCSETSEEEVSFSCGDSSDVCCKTKSSSDDEGGSMWIWILVVLIVVVLGAIIFVMRDKIKLFLFKSKQGGSSKPGFAGGPRPGMPPYGARPGFPPIRRMPPQQQQRSVQRKDSSMDDVFKKLREMSK